MDAARQTELLAHAGKYLAGGGTGLFVLPPELIVRRSTREADLPVASSAPDSSPAVPDAVDPLKPRVTPS